MEGVFILCDRVEEMSFGCFDCLFLGCCLSYRIFGFFVMVIEFMFLLKFVLFFSISVFFLMI